MLKKTFVAILCISLVLTILPVKGINESVSLKGGWLEIRNGIKILHINGSNYEMGFQHGYLLKEEVKQNIRAFLDYSFNSLNVTYEHLLEIWNVMKDYVPQEYIDEIQGIADGAGISFDEIAAANMVIIVGDTGCFGISAWGNATADGKLYHTRSFDLPFNIKDPETDKYAHENSVLIVRNPNNGYASISPSIAGSMHGGGGFNNQGIAIGQQVCWSKDYTLNGTPGQFRVQMVLDYASNISEAINILTNNKDFGWNFIISDSKTPIGYAVETTANHRYFGTYDDLTENTPPFWKIEYVVRRTNFFIDKTIASTQRKNYNPSGLISFIKLLFRIDVFFAVYRSYKVVSIGIEKNHGYMDLNNTMDMIRNCYSGKTDFLLRLIVTKAEGTSFNRAWNMWVACPQTGDLVVCFASKDKIAFNNPVYYFNFYDLLNAVPK